MYDYDCVSPCPRVLWAAEPNGGFNGLKSSFKYAQTKKAATLTHCDCTIYQICHLTHSPTAKKKKKSLFSTLHSVVWLKQSGTVSKYRGETFVRKGQDIRMFYYFIFCFNKQSCSSKKCKEKWFMWEAVCQAQWHLRVPWITINIEGKQRDAWRLVTLKHMKKRFGLLYRVEIESIQ